MALPSPSGLASAITAKIPFLKRNKSGSHMRAHQRVPCCLMAELLIVERGFKLEGLVIEVSRGGMRFREASNFILRRDKVKVAVLAAGAEFPGMIVNTGANGYGIKLDALVAEEELERLVASGSPQGLTPN